MGNVSWVTVNWATVVKGKVGQTITVTLGITLSKLVGLGIDRLGNGLGRLGKVGMGRDGGSNDVRRSSNRIMCTRVGHKR